MIKLIFCYFPIFSVSKPCERFKSAWKWLPAWKWSAVPELIITTITTRTTGAGTRRRPDRRHAGTSHWWLTTCQTTWTRSSPITTSARWTLTPLPGTTIITGRQRRPRPLLRRHITATHSPSPLATTTSRSTRRSRHLHRRHRMVSPHYFTANIYINVCTYFNVSTTV